MTGLDLVSPDNNSGAWDPWKYYDQMNGPLLTGSSKAHQDFLKWRKDHEYCAEDAAAIVKKEQECEIMTFDEYFESRH